MCIINDKCYAFLFLYEDAFLALPDSNARNIFIKNKTGKKQTNKQNKNTQQQQLQQQQKVLMMIYSIVFIF